MATKAYDTWVWLGLGLFLGSSVNYISSHLHAAVNAIEAEVEVEDNEDQPVDELVLTADKTIEQPEDDIPLDVLQTLAICPTYDIREAATKILAQRFASSILCMSQTWHDHWQWKSQAQPDDRTDPAEHTFRLLLRYELMPSPSEVEDIKSCIRYWYRDLEGPNPPGAEFWEHEDSARHSYDQRSEDGGVNDDVGRGGERGVWEHVGPMRTAEMEAAWSAFHTNRAGALEDVTGNLGPSPGEEVDEAPREYAGAYSPEEMEVARPPHHQFHDARRPVVHDGGHGQPVQRHGGALTRTRLAAVVAEIQPRDVTELEAGLRARGYVPDYARFGQDEYGNAYVDGDVYAAAPSPEPSTYRRRT